MNTRNPVGWFEIYVEDMARAQKFYETVLKLKLEKLPKSETVENSMSMMMFPGNNELPGSGGALVHMNGFNAGANSTIIYFMSNDCSIEESRVEGAGGKVFKQKMSIGDYGFVSLCNDTEGNMFGIHSMS